MSGVHRRQFLQTALTAAAGLVLPQTIGCDLRLSPGELPFPGASGIEHVVVTMMENRSFDHLLGWLPNADGKQSGLTFVDRNGGAHATHPLAPDFTGCAAQSPDNSYTGGRVDWNGGAMDGFLRAANDLYAIGYYEQADQPFFSQLALNYTALDRYFCPALTGSGPNALFLNAAASDRIDGSIGVTTLPTIWDRLADAGLSRRYYKQSGHGSALDLWGTKYAEITRTHDEFYADVAAGMLATVTFMVPGSANEHPPADLRSGEAFLSAVYGALTSAPTWNRTVWVITYDEWGGFFDHVPPPRAAAANPADTDVVNGKTLLGFRVPTIVVSPFSRGRNGRNRVNSLTYDHASILKMIEWRWGLAPLSARDASDDVANLALALDFNNRDASAPALPVVVDPGFTVC